MIRIDFGIEKRKKQWIHFIMKSSESEFRSKPQKWGKRNTYRQQVYLESDSRVDNHISNLRVCCTFWLKAAWPHFDGAQESERIFDLQMPSGMGWVLLCLLAWKVPGCLPTCFVLAARLLWYLPSWGVSRCITRLPLPTEVKQRSGGIQAILSSESVKWRLRSCVKHLIFKCFLKTIRNKKQKSTRAAFF